MLCLLEEKGEFFRGIKNTRLLVANGVGVTFRGGTL